MIERLTATFSKTLYDGRGNAGWRRMLVSAASSESHVPRNTRLGAAGASRCIGHGIPSAARIGQCLAATLRWHTWAGRAPDSPAQHTIGTKSAKDVSWQSSQTPTTACSRGRSHLM
jgi:hypothetical protein